MTQPESLVAPRRDGGAPREFLSEKLFAAERAMTGVRLGVSLFCAAIYFTLLDPRLTIPWLALPIAVLARSTACWS